MNTKAVILTIAVLLLLSGFLIWTMGRPDPTLNSTAPDKEENVDQPRLADTSSPTAPVCAFQEGSTITFELSEGIPAPRCARALSEQFLAFKNNTDEVVTFSFAGSFVSIEPRATASRDESVGNYLASGVHKINMDLYGGSGPEVWVMDSSVREVMGTITQTFVSAKAVVVETEAGEEVSVAIGPETRIFDDTGAGIDVDNFSLALKAGTRISAIVDFENDDTGTALEIQVE